MVDYVALANAIKTTLEADSWVGNIANVKTVETYSREFSLQGEEGAPFYKDTELPAMAITPNAQGKSQDGAAVGEILESVASEVMTVTFHSVVLTAAQEHDTIIKNLERVLDAQKTSSADLGIDALVKDVSTETERFKKGANYFHLSRTRFTVLLTATY